MTLQRMMTACITLSTSVLGSCCESWRPLSANTRASTPWTSSVQLAPSSPQSKVSCDLPWTHAWVTHSFRLGHTNYSSTHGLFSVSAYLTPPPSTVLSIGHPLFFHSYHVLSLSLSLSSQDVLVTPNQGKVFFFVKLHRDSPLREVIWALRMFQTP